MTTTTPTRAPAPGRHATGTAGRHSDRFNAVLLVLGLVGLMWAVEIVDLVAGDLDSHGIQPREADGLPGVVFAPFLHAGFGHLIGNTIPFVMLGLIIAVGGLARVAIVTAIIVVLGGLCTWLVAPQGSVHVGASGVVFGYATYLIVRGFFSRRAIHLAVGVVLALLYGTTLLVGFVPTPGVSWQGHFFGAVGGIVAARFMHRRDVLADARAAT